MADSNPRPAPNEATPGPDEAITETEIVQPQTRRRGIVIVAVVVDCGDCRWILVAVDATARTPTTRR